MVDWKTFAIAALASNKEGFIIYIAYLRSKMSIYTACKAQVALLLAKNISVLEKYANFLDVFSIEFAVL